MSDKPSARADKWILLTQIMTPMKGGAVAIAPYFYTFNEATGDLKVQETPQPPQKLVTPASAIPTAH